MTKKNHEERESDKRPGSPTPLPGEIHKLRLGKGQLCPQVSSHGRFRNMRGAIFNPKPMKSGRVKVKIQGRDYCLAALICRGAHGPAPSEKHIAQHLNLDPTDNRETNLKWMTKKESAQHARKLNKNRRSNAMRISKPIRGRRVVHKAGGCKENSWTKYEMGAAEAAKRLGLDKSGISKCCNGTLKTTGDYEFEYDLDVNLLSGEQFREVVFGDGQYDVPLRVLEDLNNSDHHLQIPEVSNKGRWMDTQGVVKTPAPHPSGYSYAMIMGVNFGLHGLVCRAFHGSPPSATDTPDHIDRDTTNNYAENLRWATKLGRTSNKHPDRESSEPRLSKPVESRRVVAGGNDQEEIWQRFDNHHHAAEVTGVSESSIRGCCKQLAKNINGWEFCYNEIPNHKGEVWYDVMN